MNNQDRIRADAPRRLAAESTPSLLVAGRDAELRLFLRGSLQQWYEVTEAHTGDEVISHLTHCPPKALIAGPLRAGDTEGIISALRETGGPPVLKLWVTSPPAGWVDAALRHPFTRADLLRAVDRLVYADAEERARGDAPDPEAVSLQAHAGS